MPGAHLRITGTGPTTHGYTVELDGQEITRSLFSLQFDQAANEVNVATLTLRLDNLEVDAEVEVKIRDGLFEAGFLPAIAEQIERHRDDEEFMERLRCIVDGDRETLDALAGGDR